MYPPQAPWTGLGQLEREIDSVKSELHRKAETHEIHTLDRKLDSLERECREIRSSIDGILSRLQTLEENQLVEHSV